MDKMVNGKWSPVDVSTAEFVVVRNDKENYRLVNNDPNAAFCEFGDSGPRKQMAFVEDMKKAISEGLYGPAWDAFKQCLSSGELFALITARGNAPSTYRSAVEYIIDSVLSENEKFLLYSNCLKHAYFFAHDENFDRIPKGRLSETPLVSVYLDNCYYYGVSSPEFAAEFGEGSASNPEMAKERALDKFIEKCNELGRQIGAKSVSVGFSDDDPKNVDHVKKYFKEKSELSKNLTHKLKLSLYKTTDRSIKGGERVKLDESSSSWGSGAATWGTDSSVLPFSKWNNMTQKLYPNSADAPTDDYHNQFKNQIGQLKNLTEDDEYDDDSYNGFGCCPVCTGERDCECGCPECNYPSDLLARNFDEDEDMDESRKWIKDAIKRPGSLRRKLHKKKGDKISSSELDSELQALRAKDKDKKKPGLQLSKRDSAKHKQIVLAKTLRGMRD